MNARNMRYNAIQLQLFLARNSYLPNLVLNANIIKIKKGRIKFNPDKIKYHAIWAINIF